MLIPSYFNYWHLLIYGYIFLSSVSFKVWIYVEDGFRESLDL